MLEGLAMIFVVFIVVMVVVFEKKEYGNLWVGLQTTGLIFMMIVAPFSSIFALVNEIPLNAAWVFYLFSALDIVYLVFHIYIGRKVSTVSDTEHRLGESIKIDSKASSGIQIQVCPQCLFIPNTFVSAHDECCPYCRTKLLKYNLYINSSSDDFHNKVSEEISTIIDRVKSQSSYSQDAHRERENRENF